jgi:hypothetical protein
MRRLLLALLLAVAALAGPFATPAQADQDSERILRERIEQIRRLPREEQERLRAALQRFRSKPQAEQRRLRERADEVGKDRLSELAGRDVGRLRKRHSALDRERQEIVRLLGGEERFAAWEPVEKRYIVNLAVRSFQKHVRRTLLDIAGPNEMEAFNQLPKGERKAKMGAAVHHLEANLLAAETPESRAQILALPPHEQRRRRRELLAEHRLSLIPSFIGVFERYQVQPFLEMAPEKRRRTAQRWDQRARWFEIRHRLEREVGVSRDVLRMLSELAPEDWARVRDEYDRTAELPAAERRLRLEGEIRAIHGRSAVSTDGAERPRNGRARGARGRGKLRRMMRDERRRRRPRDDVR